jgi:hypothetical protein
MPNSNGGLSHQKLLCGGNRPWVHFFFLFFESHVKKRYFLFEGSTITFPWSPLKDSQFRFSIATAFVENVRRSAVFHLGRNLLPLLLSNSTIYEIRSDPVRRAISVVDAWLAPVYSTTFEDSDFPTSFTIEANSPLLVHHVSTEASPCTGIISSVPHYSYDLFQIGRPDPPVPPPEFVVVPFQVRFLFWQGFCFLLDLF